MKSTLDIMKDLTQKTQVDSIEYGANLKINNLVDLRSVKNIK